jgi:hydrogenase maturation protein HypF
MSRFLISIKGIVQGVGFRPFIYNLAKSLDLKGYVKNTSDGVIIEAEGESLNEFLLSIQNKCPPLARIDSIETKELPLNGYEDFVIIQSVDDGSFTLVSPDISICDDCLKEMLDHSDRRYLYPFINCTNCGPRYSITQRVPYDRPNTTMSVFDMCPRCLSEYNDPLNRRFHAQPNACHECGPQLKFQISNFKFQISRPDPVEAAIELLKRGAIIAIKGLGGFHLCCDAENEDAVRRLREKKRRSNKPFALMSPDTEAVRQFCEVSDEEEKLLTDRRRPIVLLKKRSEVRSQRSEVKKLPDKIAPNNKYLGFMLPYAPLHYLLFHYPIADSQSPIVPHFSALVMTSGNLSEEPIVISNDEAVSKLSDIADAFVLHNRDIFMRVDDSVIKAIGNRQEAIGKEQIEADQTQNYLSPKISFIRRARGYVPEPIQLNDDGPDVLGCGADIKNTFTITKGGYAIASQHIGDMENLETLNFFEETLNNLKQVYRANPVAIAYDLHPNYLSTQWALRLKDSNESIVTSNEWNKEDNNSLKNLLLVTKNSSLVFYGIQHHYAHIASVMAESGIKDKVIGIAFDGTGYGTDGNLWGGEFLICDLKGFERAAHFKYIPLPGGDRAIKECWRTAISYIVKSVGFRVDSYVEFLDSIGFVDRYGRDRIENILRLIDNKQFSPLSSGAGRLFDAASAIAGICDENTFEGEAAIALESMLHCSHFMVHSEKYPYEILDTNDHSPIHPSTYSPIIVDFSKMIVHILEDVEHKEDKSLIAVRFHNTLINAVTETVSRISKKYRIKDVALSGGVFQNEYLLKGAVSQLSSLGFDVHTNEKVPCNDAGISLGQAYIARERIKAGMLV